jgi:hypothetical protein
MSNPIFILTLIILRPRTVEKPPITVENALYLGITFVMESFWTEVPSIYGGIQNDVIPNMVTL